MPTSSDTYTYSYPIGNVSGLSSALCRVQEATFQFDDVNQLNVFQSSFNSNFGNYYGNDFYYGIQSITYTASQPVIDNLKEAVQAIIDNNNENTDKIIANHNQKAEEIKQSLAENTDKIIDSLETPSDEIRGSFS